VPEGLAVGADGLSIYESQENSVFEADGNDGYYLDHESNLANCRRKLAFVRRHLPGGARVCDVGANFGHFLKAASSVYRVAGFDVSPSAVAWSRGSFGVENVVGSIYEPPTEGVPWDAVTCWDVLEHLADPRAALLRVAELLRPDGWLFASTPDSGSLVAQALGRRWHYLDPIQHINVFSRASLRMLLEEVGFEVVEATALGHSYRLRYVWDRLCYLHAKGVLGASLRFARQLTRPLAGCSVYLQLGDVLILAAKRRDPLAIHNTTPANPR
jgi:2-polyprenyl-3-methyl-5-hydroxy-6-metoxy-1,4-benzoquinol methylase